MNDWKKAVVGSAFAFCLISAFVGIFSLIGVVQMMHYDLIAGGARVSPHGDFLTDMQILSAVSLAVLVVCAGGLLCYRFFTDRASKATSGKPKRRKRIASRNKTEKTNKKDLANARSFLSPVCQSDT